MKFNPYIMAAHRHVGSKPVEVIQQEYGLEAVAKLSSNENPLGPSPLAVKAVQAVSDRINHYPDFGDEALRQALADSIAPDLSADHFITGNGACDVLMMLAHCFLTPGDEYIICRPTFPVYEATANRTGAKPIYVDLAEDDFSYDIEAILVAITERTRLIYLCSPNNPTGNIVSATQMATLVSQLPAEVLLITDEVYHHFVTADNYPDSLNYVKQGHNVVIVHSLSKVFGLAGIRLGYAIARPEIAQYVSRFRLPYHINKLTVQAGMAALTDHDHINQTISLTVAGRDWLYQQLSELPGVRAWPSEANFVLFQVPTEPAEIVEQLLRRGIMVRPMKGFYLPHHLRVTVGLPADNERFIAALREF